MFLAFELGVLKSHNALNMAKIVQKQMRIYFFNYLTNYVGEKTSVLDLKKLIYILFH